MSALLLLLLLLLLFTENMDTKLVLYCIFNVFVLYYPHRSQLIIIIITDNFCIALFSGVPKLTALYNILQHFLSFTNVIHIIMTTNYV